MEMSELLDFRGVLDFPDARKKQRRRLTIAVGAAALSLFLLERYNQGVSRAGKAAKRALAAAFAAWVEDRGGLPLFTLEGEEPPGATNSIIDLNQLYKRYATLSMRASQDGTNLPVIARPVVPVITESAAEGSDHVPPSPGPAQTPPSPGYAFWPSAATPNFFQSTKFFACLDVEEAKELFRQTLQVPLQPHEVLFRSGENSESGIFIVVQGSVGVFLDEGNHQDPVLANTLRYGESVGDLDVVDGARRSVTCIALEEGCLLVQVPRKLFHEFVARHPRALLLYLQQGIARLWRVAHFMLSDFLQLPLHRHQSRGRADSRDARDGSEYDEGTDAWLYRSISRQPSVARPGDLAIALHTEDYLPRNAAAGSSSFADRGVSAAPASPPRVTTASASLPPSSSSTTIASTAASEHDSESSIRPDPASGTTGGTSSERQSPATAVSLDYALEISDTVSDDWPVARRSDPGTSKSLMNGAGGTAAGQGAVSRADRGGPNGRVSPTGNEPEVRAKSVSFASPDKLRVIGGAGGGAATHTPSLGGARPPSIVKPAIVSAFRSIAPRKCSSASEMAAVQEDGTAQEGEVTGSTLTTASSVPQPQRPSRSLEEGMPVPDPASTPKLYGATKPGKFGGRDSATDVATAAAAHAPDSTLVGSSNGATGGSSAGNVAAGGRGREGSDGGSSLNVSSYHGSSHHGSGGRGGQQQQFPTRETPFAWQRSSSSFVTREPAFKSSADRPAGPSCRYPRSASLASALAVGQRACLSGGWDVVDVEELQVDDETWAAITDPFQTHGQPVRLQRGTLLQDVDWACSQFYILLEGHMEATRQAHVVPGGTAPPRGAAAPPAVEAAVAAPGCLISCAAFLSSTATRCKVTALEPATLIAFGWPQLEALVTEAPAVLMQLLLAASHALGPVIRRFISLGLNRVWLKSGDVPYRQGAAADCLYVVISGRLRLVHESVHPVSQKVQGRIEDEVGRGEAVGAVWAITGGNHDTTALCVRDSELVRMSQAAFRVISEDSPWAMSKLFGNIARRLVAALDSRVRTTRMEKAPGSGVGAAVQLPPTGFALKPSGTLKTTDSGSSSGGTAGGVKKASGRHHHEIVTIAILPAGRVVPSSALPSSGSSAGGLQAQSSSGSGKGSFGHPGSNGYATDATGAAYAYETSTLGGPGGGGRQAAGRSHGKQLPDVTSLIAVKRLANALKEALQEFGPVLMLNSTTCGLLFPTAFERLDVLFYRSKITSWMASQEEEYKFIVMEADVQPTPWSSICVSQADSILLVAPEGAHPQLGHIESAIVFNNAPYPMTHVIPSGSSATSSALSSSMSHLPGAAASRTHSEEASHSSRADVGGHLEAPSVPPAVKSVSNKSPHDSISSMSSPVASAGGGGGGGGAAAATPSTPGSSRLSSPQNTFSYLCSSLAHAAGFGARESSPSDTTAAAAPPPATAGGAVTATGAAVPAAAAASAAAPRGASGSSSGSTGSASKTRFEGTGGTGVPPASSAHDSSSQLQQANPLATGPIPCGVAGTFHSQYGSCASLATGHPVPGPAWLAGNPSSVGSGAGLGPGATAAATLRRVELVLLHSGDGIPGMTSMWLQERPHLTRHHHVRLARTTDVQRLARWIAGKAVGLVLSGGGSRGLAHLGVLCALEDQGVPIDVVGGTSQGAFMAAVFAQGQSRDAMQACVRTYAQSMGSVRHLLCDLTLPILSVFSGTAFDEAIKQVFSSGAQRLEDLWLNFFCVTTNLSRGEPSVHTQGILWKLVRASMTIVGLLPPVFEEGDLLVDGGYMNNIPVDVMRSLGVDTVIVVDVENRDDAGWRNLTPYDGGVSGWHLLWDRWCPVPRWRFNVKIPKYSQIINQLTWMTHAHNLKRVSEDYKIDLYMRPPNIGAFKLMDYHLMDKIVKEAYRYATTSIRQFKTEYCVSIRGVEEPGEVLADMTSLAPGINAVGQAGQVGHTLPPGGLVGQLSPTPAGHRWDAGGTHVVGHTHTSPGGLLSPGSGPVPSAGSSIMCMTQLQRRQQQQALDSSGGSPLPPAAVAAMCGGASNGGSMTQQGVSAAAAAAAAAYPVSAGGTLSAGQVVLQASGKALTRIPTRRSVTQLSENGDGH